MLSKWILSFSALRIRPSLRHLSFLLVAFASSLTQADQIASLATGRDSLESRMALISDPAAMKIEILTFTLKEDAVGLLLLSELVKRAQAGARVRLGYDAFSSRISPETAEYVRSQGVDLRVFRPLRMDWRAPVASLKSLIGFNNRAHQKVLVVNDSVAIVGSANYSEDYFLSLRQREARGRWTFKDREILISGDSVRSMVGDFDRKWGAGDFVSPAADSPISPERLAFLRESFQEKAQAKIRASFQIPAFRWPEVVHQVGTVRYVSDEISFVAKSAHVHQAVLELIRGAQKEVLIESPYLVIPKDLFLEIREAIARGVDVQVLTNSPDGSDEGDVGEMSKKEIARLASIGAKISFYKLFHVFHGKVIVADQARIFWGSYNLDMRSKLFNLENGVFFESAEIAKELEQKRVWEGFEAKSIQVTNGQMRVEARKLRCSRVFSSEAQTYSTRLKPSVLLKRPLL